MLKKSSLTYLWSNHGVSLTLLVFSFVFLQCFLISYPSNGDTYVYAFSISNFEGPLIHIGYYALGFIFYKLLSVFSVTAVMSLNILSVFCASIAIVVQYKIITHLTKNKIQSILSAIVLLFSGSFWLYAEHGEVYIPQLLFVLLSVFLILEYYPFLSSISILIAISITPTSTLAIPGIIYLMYFKKYPWKTILYFAIPIFFVGLFILLLEFSKVQNIIYEAVYSPKHFFENFSIFELFKKIVGELVKVYGKAFNLFSLCAIVGIIVLYKRDRNLFKLLLIFLVPFSLYIFNLGLISGDHLIISFFIISYLGVSGLFFILDYLNLSSRKTYFIISAVIIFHAWFSYELYIYQELRDEEVLKEVVENLSEKYERNAIMMSSYNFGMPFWYLTQEEDDYFFRTGRPNYYLKKHGVDCEGCTKRLENRFWINNMHFIDFLNYIDIESLLRTKNRKIYFVDRNDWPTWIVKLLVPDSTLETRKKSIPKISRLSNYFRNKLGYNVRIDKFISSNLYQVYEVQF